MVNVLVRARYPLPLPDRPNNHYIFEIPTDSPFIPRMRVRRHLPRRPRGGVWAPVLRLSKISDVDLQPLQLPHEVLERLRDGKLELEELLERGLTLRYFAWGTDASTGALAVKVSEHISDTAQIVCERPQEVAP